MGLVANISKKYEETKLFVKSHPIVSAGLFVITAFITTLFNMAIDSTIKYFAPSLDDTAEIIHNQNQQFDQVKKNLSKLQSALASEDREVLAELRESYEKTFDSSQKIAISYAIVNKENESLRKMLQNQKGMDGGYDILLEIGKGFRIDNAVSFGTRPYGSKALFISLTSLKAEESKKDEIVDVGEGVKFTDVRGKACSLVFLGVHKEQRSPAMATFAKQCI